MTPEPDHHETCYTEHFECAQKHIRDLEVKISQLQCGVIEPDWMKRLREPGVVPCGDETQTGGQGGVFLVLHRAGPTWSHHSDDPPTR